MRVYEQVKQHYTFPDYITEREFQLDTIDILAPEPRAGLYLGTGVGKTFVSTAMMLYKMAIQGRDTNIVTMPPILIPQWFRWLSQIKTKNGKPLKICMYRGSPKQRQELDIKSFDFILMSMQVFKNDFTRIVQDTEPLKVTMAIDEATCFPAGTKISTPTGLKNIETFSVGDVILTSCGVKNVTQVMQSLTSEMTSLRLSNGTSIRCTASHPIFTDIGWVAARDCQHRKLLLGHEMSDVQRGVQKIDIDFTVGSEKQDSDRDDLLSLLWSETAVDYQPRCTTPSDSRDARCTEIRQEAETLYSGEMRSIIGDGESSRTQTNPTRGKRNRANSCRASDNRSDGGPRVPLELRSCPWVERQWLPQQLQARLWAHRFENRLGGGRQFPPATQSPSSRQEERGETSGTWVESVSSEKLTTPTTVWNLEVAGCPNYFAGDVLVHNCIKNVQSQNYRHMRDFLLHGDVEIMLLTGTPLTTPLDGFAFIKTVAPTVYKSLTQFENCHVGERDFFGKITSWRNLDLLADNLKVNSVRIQRREVYKELPPVIFSPIEYELDPAHYKLYRKLVEEQLLELPDGSKIDSTQENALYHHTQQLVLNYAHFSGVEANVAVGFDLVENELLELGDQKLVVIANYRMTNATLVERFKAYGAVAIYGAVSPTQKELNVQRFINDASCRVLIIQPTSGGFGLDGLQHVCSNMMFLELPRSPRDFNQTLARLDREGQTDAVQVKIAVANRTVQVKLLHDMVDKDQLIGRVQPNFFDLRSILLGGEK